MIRCCVAGDGAAGLPRHHRALNCAGEHHRIVPPRVAASRRRIASCISCLAFCISHVHIAQDHWVYRRRVRGGLNTNEDSKTYDEVIKHLGDIHAKGQGTKESPLEIVFFCFFRGADTTQEQEKMRWREMKIIRN